MQTNIPQGGILFIPHTLRGGGASVVLQAQAFFTLLFAVTLLNESVTLRQLAGLGLAAIGLYLVGSISGKASEITSVALLLTLAGAAFWGMSNIVVRKATSFAASQGEKLDMLSMVVWSALIPPAPLLVLSYLIESPDRIFGAISHLNGVAIFSVAYLAFGATLLGYGAWSYLLSRHPANRVALWSLLVPVAGLITARIVLNERLSVIQWIGCLLVVAGLVVAFSSFFRWKSAVRSL